MAKNAIVLEEDLHLLRAQLQREQRGEVLRSRDVLFLDRLVQQLFKVVVKPGEVGLFVGSDNRFTAFVFRRQHLRQLRILRRRTWVRGESGGGKEERAENEDLSLHVALDGFRCTKNPAAIPTAAKMIEISPANR